MKNFLKKFFLMKLFIISYYSNIEAMFYINLWIKLIIFTEFRFLRNFVFLYGMRKQQKNSPQRKLLVFPSRSRRRSRKIPFFLQKLNDFIFCKPFFFCNFFHFLWLHSHIYHDFLIKQFCPICVNWLCFPRKASPTPNPPCFGNEFSQLFIDYYFPEFTNSYEKNYHGNLE